MSVPVSWNNSPCSRWSVCVLVLVFLVFGPGVYGEETASVSTARLLHIGMVRDFAPYQFEQDGCPTGYDIELVQAVARAIGYSVAFETGSWDTIRRDVVSGRLDAIAGMTIMPSGDSLFRMSVSTCEVTYAIFTKQGNGVYRAADLGTKTVAISRDSAMISFLRGRPMVTNLIYADDDANAMERLRLGLADAAILPRDQGKYYVNKHNLPEIYPLDDEVFSGGHGLVVLAENASLLMRFNEGLSLLESNGQFEQIFRRWFGADAPRIPRKVIHLFLTGASILFLLFLASLLLVHLLRKHIRVRAMELAESEAQYRLLTENVPDMISRHAPNGRILYVSSMSYTLLGYEPESLLGRYPQEYIHPDDLPLMADSLQAIVNTPSISRDICRARHKMGHYIWVEVTNRSLSKTSGDVVSEILSVTRDVTERVLAEETLRREREFSRLVLDNVADAVIACDGKGRIQFINNAARRWHGVEQAPIIPEQWASYYHLFEDDEVTLLPMDRIPLRRAFMGEEIRGEALSIMVPGEEPRHVLASAVPIYDEHGHKLGAVVALHDVTQQRHAEKVLRESEARFHSAILESPFPIMLYAEDGEILMLSRSWSEITGYTREDIPTLCAWIAQSGEVASEGDVFPVKQIPVPGGRCDEGEFVVVTKCGEKRIWDFSSAFLGRSGNRNIMLRIAKDVTERKYAEEEANRLVTAVEQAAEAVMITDTRVRIVYVNPAFTRITGYSSDDALGHIPRLLRDHRQNRTFYEDLWKTLRRGEVWFGHFVNRRKNGSQYEAECTISPVRNASGAIVNYVALIRDVTHELELEQQLHQAQKMEAIGTLAGGIAHDFNNILQSIMGYAELARSETPENTQARSSMVEVLTASERARELVAQILAFSRLSENERAPVQIQQVLKEALKLLRGSLPSNIEIHAQLDDACYPVLADSTRIQQIIINLCTNAYHAMRETGGILQIDLEMTGDLPELRSFSQEGGGGGHVLLTVKDTGCGMNKNTLKRIFDPYFTTKKQGEGTGLGLAVVHGIVQELGGTIFVDSTPGKGTQFRIYFPICLAIPTSPEKRKPVTEEDYHGTECVLLVDDEASAVRMMDIALSQLGYKVVACTNGMDALTIFQAEPHRFDIVVTDQTMPQMTGIRLVDGLIGIRPDLPVILCSGYSDVVDEAKAKAKGVREFMTKPFLPNKLLETIRRILDSQLKKGV